MARVEALEKTSLNRGRPLVDSGIERLLEDEEDFAHPAPDPIVASDSSPEEDIETPSSPDDDDDHDDNASRADAANGRGRRIQRESS